jgi:hypothetical protein
MPRSMTQVISMTQCTLPAPPENVSVKCWHGPVASGDAGRERACSPMVREMCPPCPRCGVRLLPG